MREIDMSTKFNPNEVEKGKYEKWQDQGLFNPDNNAKDSNWQGNNLGKDGQPATYSIVIPPPNVTGKLHLGHAWDTTLQDMLIRYKRMQGFDTLWFPGMDHAGIATQAKVEARLREEGISRYDLGRDNFVKKVWEWKDEYSSIIKKQWGKLGLSLDFTRERFTLDEGLNKAVNKSFVELYKKGLIYRGEYIINWDPVARTALSDIEVNYQDDPGYFYHLKYQFSDGSGFIEVATTRPETMYGDMAVAVSPKDESKKNLIGKTVIVPIVNREIPIIADEIVDPEFGSGFVKITPAHDPNDFEAGNRHNLKRLNTINEDGTMNELAGDLNGLTIVDARNKIVEQLKKANAVIEIEEYTHSVGHSERTGAVVEPRLSTQWFVKMKPLAMQALKMQEDKDGKVNFWPNRFEDVFTRWMENIRDWVISRQIWWGHQIPAWYKNGEIYVGEQAPEGEGWVRDNDVLDTWFSSALWPFSIMGWPENLDDDFAKYFPTSALVTGYDIIFFWIARMMFQSKEFTGQAPFKNVLIHGLARDEQGRKMSKSLGNGIDPMDVIEKYGADALRWFLSTGSTPGQDIRFSYDRMDASWNFINKIWNISRFILMNIDDDAKAEIPNELSITDKWILSRLNSTTENVIRNFEKFEFGEAGKYLYNFIWNDFADWYIEFNKISSNSNVMLYVLDQIMRLLHPIMPFVTEEIFTRMPANANKTLVTARYPVVNTKLFNESAENSIQSLIELITAVRNIRSEVGISKKQPIRVLIKTEKLKDIFENNREYIQEFVNPEILEIGDISIKGQFKTAIISNAEIFVPLEGLIDIDAEIKKMQSEALKFKKEVERASIKLNNQKFIDSAPAQVVKAVQDSLEDWQSKLEAINKNIQELKK
ncbi:MAG: valine--tRNA ligase [Lactobacillaceae bacterium]|jgi:valyl-tRNA synthetase|nr:valine--tRNA ligase [Lactobacillaceae bacterium]